MSLDTRNYPSRGLLPNAPVPIVGGYVIEGDEIQLFDLNLRPYHLAVDRTGADILVDGELQYPPMLRAGIGHLG